MIEPCPFCGWSATLNDISWEQPWCNLGIEHMWVVECDGCHARSQPFSNKDDAVWNWNKRVEFRSPMKVTDVAKIIHKSPAYVRAMIINGKIPGSCATRNGSLVTDASEINGKKGRINYFISPVGWEIVWRKEFWEKHVQKKED